MTLKFNERLKALIEEKEITQKQAAKDLNIAPSTMGGYAQGTSEPDFETLKKLAQYFGVTSDYLLGLPEQGNEGALEEELLHVFRKLCFEQKLLYIEQSKAFNRTQNLLKKMEKSSAAQS